MKEIGSGTIEINQGQLYYERSGSGIPLIFIHGAFTEMHMFDPQWDYFVGKAPILRFDLRGHGKSGSSGLAHYRMNTYIDDLMVLMDVLDVPKAVIIGQSWGGSIAQGFASRYPERMERLVLSGSMVSMSLTLGEKIQRYVLVPKWLMGLIIRSVSVQNFVKFSFLLSDIFFGKDFLSHDIKTANYLKNTMLSIGSQEYLKIWEALYDFDLFPLERISCPILVINGEKEPRKMMRHSKEILNRTPDSRQVIIPGAKHSMNLDNPKMFNQTIDEFRK